MVAAPRRLREWWAVPARWPLPPPHPELRKRRSPAAPRYLLYDVNPPEGFNLRRDVYIRVASLLKTLLETEEWVLVLPPWGRLYHWQSPDIHQVRIPWSDFFDLPSLNRNIPVIEYEQFIAGEAVVAGGQRLCAAGRADPCVRGASLPFRTHSSPPSCSFQNWSRDADPKSASAWLLPLKPGAAGEPAQGAPTAVGRLPVQGPGGLPCRDGPVSPRDSCLCPRGR